MNIAIVSGNIGKDPDLRFTQSGTAKLTFSVASKSRRKVDGEWQDETEWHNVLVWGKRAEGLGKFLAKGMFVVIQGELHTSSWEKDGVKRYRTEIWANEVDVGPKGSRERRDDAQPPPPQSQQSFDDPQDDDDIPF
jgi:single-strand DNA-binding protein